MSSTHADKSVIAQIQAKLGIYSDGSVQLEIQFPAETHDFHCPHCPTPQRTPPQSPPVMAAQRRAAELPPLTPFTD